MLLHLFLEGEEGSGVLLLLLLHGCGMLLEEEVVVREPTVEDGKVLDQSALDHLNDIN